MKRNTSGRAGDFFAETWIRFELDPAPGASGAAERRDVTVIVSTDLELTWSLAGADRDPVLFWAAVYEGVLKGQDEVNLTTSNAPGECPTEWRRPVPAQSATFEVDFPGRGIGFQA